MEIAQSMTPHFNQLISFLYNAILYQYIITEQVSNFQCKYSVCLYAITYREAQAKTNKLSVVLINECIYTISLFI